MRLRALLSYGGNINQAKIVNEPIWNTDICGSIPTPGPDLASSGRVVSIHGDLNPEIVFERVPSQFYFRGGWTIIAMMRPQSSACRTEGLYRPTGVRPELPAYPAACGERYGGVRFAGLKNPGTSQLSPGLHECRAGPA